jgi:hypothetical protein
MAFSRDEVLTITVQVVAAGVITADSGRATIIHGFWEGRPVLLYAAGSVTSQDELSQAKEIVITDAEFSADEFQKDNIAARIATAWQDMGYQTLIKT